jgi:diadenosine tetraphosphate (Ap4A) HIT family hydrolase
MVQHAHTYAHTVNLLASTLLVSLLLYGSKASPGHCITYTQGHVEVTKHVTKHVPGHCVPYTQGHVEVVEELLSGHGRKTVVRMKNKEGRTPLHLAGQLTLLLY